MFKRFARSACLVLLGLSLTTVASFADDLKRWEAMEVEVDQSVDPVPQNSGLAGVNDVLLDHQLAEIVKPFVVNRKVKFIWVFSQCFGAGMFDELNALGGTQSGVSASHYDQCSKYQILRPQGNGVNFSTALYRSDAWKIPREGIGSCRSR